MDKLKKLLGQYEKPKILDVATGVGNYIAIIDDLYKDYDQIIGIDLLDHLIEIAKKNFKDNDKVSFLKMDAVDMSFPNETFDIVFLSNSLHHLSLKKETLSSIERVLKPQGILIINEMVSDNLDVKQLSHLKLHHFGAEIDREYGLYHEETYARDEMIKILDKTSNLRIIDEWDMVVPRREENSKEEMDYIFQVLSGMLNRVQDSKKSQYFTEKGNEIKKYIKENGYDAATSFVLVLKKK